ncbi:MAG: DUF1080 domain-containing protein [Verrucomicrobiota bacterium JB023]|nr:DUF1080 domain-containing protein [Verrucomicrobiota bacterium JB023]
MTTITFPLLSLALGALTLGAAGEETLFPDQTAAWKMAGPGDFKIENDVATSRGGMGLWWYSGKAFRNATLSLEFKADSYQHNSGIFVRFPDPGNDPWIAVRQGYEVQIAGTEVNKKATGSIYDIQAPVAIPLKPAGEWNKYEIATIESEIFISLNGELINIYQTQEGRGDEQGYFGLQNHDDNSPVSFRNVVVTEHADDAQASEVVGSAALDSYQQKSEPESPRKKAGEWYEQINFGPAHLQTFGAYIDGDYRADAALKGLVYRPFPNNPDHVALFNTETLQWITATDQGVSLDNTPWKGTHGTQNKVNNKKQALFTHAPSPAWPDESGSREDTRPQPGHGNFEHLDFKGFYRHGHQVILDYEVRGSQVLELVEATMQGDFVSVLDSDDPKIIEEAATTRESVVTQDLSPLTQGGPGIFPETFTVTPTVEQGDEPYLVDEIPLPPSLEESPWHNKVRMTDFDFFADGDRAALCSWDGDVWLLSGLKDFKELTWKRYASGLFEPLGLKIVEDIIHVSCRDGIWQLIDLNDDQEADHYQLFWNEILITDNFHEFQFGLETDQEGYFYTAKASPVRAGGRGFDKLVPHNGAVLKIAPDGSSHEVIATGLRAPGGIGVGPNGEITTGENEGTWQPCCKLNYFTQEQIPVFLGVEDTRHGVVKDFHEPLCYFPMPVDNSGGGQIWVTAESKIGLREGELLHLSYGQSSIYRVLPQELSSGQMQGGVVKLPIRLSSSAQRAAFHQDGSMYVVGMRGWQTNAANEAGFQRVRYQPETPLGLPEKMEVKGDKLILTFDVELDEELATDPTSFAIERWKYIRGPQYGSGHFSIDNPDEEAEANALKQESKAHKEHDDVEVESVVLSEDGRTVTLTIPTLKPAQQMKIDYDLETVDGDILIETIYSTIHEN